MNDENEELVTRAYNNLAGTRTTIRLDTTTWSAVDQIAEATGTTWQGWLNYLERGGTRRVSDVRREVVSWLLAQRAVLEAKALGRPRKDSSGFLLTADYPLMQAVPLDDKELHADLVGKTPGTIVGSTVTDFRGFAIKTGHRMGKPCYWIVNGMRGGSHLVLPAPARPAFSDPTPDPAVADDGVEA